MTDNTPYRSMLSKLFDRVNSGINWNTSFTKPSACPPKKKKIDKRKAEDKSETEDKKKTEDGSDVTERSLDGDLDGTSPFDKKKCLKSYCYIKMQDPCAPCHCKVKPKPPPCPPKYGPQEPRQPTCGCDLCRKNPDNEKCCDRNTVLHGINLDPKYFEKA